MAKKSDEELWRDILTRHHRTTLGWLPHSPRCAQCGVPFAGVGGAIARMVGFKRWNKNPTLCNMCYGSMPNGGIETDISVMFADLRGSTAIGEKMSPSEFATLLNRYYAVAIDVLAPHRAIIDKMIGDEVMAFFAPMGSLDHRRGAVAAAVELMRRFPEVLPHEDVPRLGIGLNAGTAYVGKVGDAGVSDFTCLGDTVNAAARLQSLAKPGEILLSEDVYRAVQSDYPDLESRLVELRGREETMPVRVLTVSPKP